MISHDSKADIDRFDAMESDELFENTLRIVKYIESALKRRDDVSRKIVNEMTSDLVKDDCRYLRDRIRYSISAPCTSILQAKSLVPLHNVNRLVIICCDG